MGNEMGIKTRNQLIPWVKQRRNDASLFSAGDFSRAIWCFFAWGTQSYEICNFGWNKQVKFYRMDVSGPPSIVEFRDLSPGKGSGLPGSHPDGKNVEKLFEKVHFSSFWRFFVTKSVALRSPELLSSDLDAEFWDLSFAMGPGAWFFQKIMIFFQKTFNFGTFWESKIGKKVKCLMKWVRLAPNELKLCRNDQARIRTSKILFFAKFSQCFGGKMWFFFFLPHPTGATGAVYHTPL